MPEELCKLVKEEFHLKKTRQYAKIVANPAFVCKKCGRVANKKARLCKPVKLD
jgi:hypothetical protein